MWKRAANYSAVIVYHALANISVTICLPLNEITETEFLHGRSTEGFQCSLKGCENEAGSQKFDTIIGQFGMNYTPDDLKSDLENLKNLRE